MCGIVGFWDLKKKYRSNKILKVINEMTKTLDHRGPDTKGTWVDKDKNLALGHRRLSILEVSNLGKQPMISKNKRYIIVFNGEIYNFVDLLNDLEKEGIKMDTKSDTRVLLEAFSNWGIKKTINKISGMFAFSLWDKYKKKLYLARDRFGIKPLYYSYVNNLFLFSSQSKSFKKHNNWKANICYKSLGSYFKYGYIPSNQSIYKDTKQVLPGHFIIFSSNGLIKEEKYWDNKEIATEYRNKHKVLNLNPIQIENKIEDAINNSVRKHMISDVSIGAFLSGGIDSSLITALMKKNTSDVKTFNIGFEDKSLDESKFASAVAKHLKTDHHEVIFKNKDLLKLIPKITNVYDEPFADSSQLPTILLSQITSKQVKVVLSGDGGDELFGGYNRYNWINKLKIIYKFPKVFRNIIYKSMKILSPNQWDNFIKLIPYFNKYSLPGDKIYKLADSINLDSIYKVYSYFISQWKDGEIPLNKINITENKYLFSHSSHFLDMKDQMQIIDMNTYLVDDILTKVDRASMAVGLEVRVPFIEENIFKYAWHYNFLKKNRESKFFLKKILQKYIPKNLIDRPKMGFAIPLAKWLRGPLRDWAEDLLMKKKLDDGYLNSKIIMEKWKEHVSGKRNWHYAIWTVLVYQSWKSQNNLLK